MRYLFLTILLLKSLSVLAEKPALMLLSNYKDQSVIGWVMSEKLDGIRAYWDGKALWTRGGVKLNPPESFTAHFPPFELDGELWLRRQGYEKTQAIVMDKTPSPDWAKLGYHIFELPNQPGGLLARLQRLKTYFETKPVAHLHLIEQHPIYTREQLHAFEKTVLSQGGEGVVIRDPNQLYQSGRLSHALKLKPKQDDECRVTGYTDGKGKFTGITGALLCDWQDAQGQLRSLKIGSGLSDTQRKNPPAIGRRVTFQYTGLTAKGLPRHPVFLRERSVK
jgi:DNA ligase-1